MKYIKLKIKGGRPNDVLLMDMVQAYPKEMISSSGIIHNESPYRETKKPNGLAIYGLNPLVAVGGNGLHDFIIFSKEKIAKPVIKGIEKKLRCKLEIIK